jgi:hypothetical protein
LLKVLERIDRYRKAGARKAVDDDAAGKRLLEKFNRIAAVPPPPRLPPGPSNSPGDAPPA